MACLFLVVDDEGKVILANDKIFSTEEETGLPSSDD